MNTTEPPDTATSSGGLTADIEVRRPGFELRVQLHVPSGGVLALLGPNGAGKSTVLRVLAGLHSDSGGAIELDGRTLAGSDIFVPAEQRAVGMVFQDYLLFPRMSARDNIAFGLRAKGIGRTKARGIAEGWLRRMGLEEFAGRRVTQLSGGQQQRVALARALAGDPALLLLDEPLAALDTTTRTTVRRDLIKTLETFGGATVLVTHDPVDALALADQVIVLENGSPVQIGIPTEIARYPRTDYVASLMGMNLLRGNALGTTITLDNGGELTSATPLDGPVLAAFRPSGVSLFRARPDGSPRNAWAGTISSIERRADSARVAITGSPDLLADVTPASIDQLGLAVGSAIWCVVKATEVDVYPA